MKSTQPGVGPLHVLEQEDGRVVGRDSLEERAPGREELLAATGCGVAQAEQAEEGGLQPLPLRRVGHELEERQPEALPRCCLIVALGETGSAAHHLGEGPERDAFAEGRRPAFVPVDRLEHPVDVLEELPGKAALPDPSLAGHGDEARLPLATRGMEEVLQQAQLVVAADERRLDPFAPIRAAALGDDPEGAERRYRGDLPLERLFPGRLECNRALRGAPGGLAHQDDSRRARPIGGATPC